MNGPFIVFINGLRISHTGVVVEYDVCRMATMLNISIPSMLLGQGAVSDVEPKVILDKEMKKCEL